MIMHEIDVMSLMGQLGRGHTATLSAHRVDALENLARDIVTFTENVDPYNFADCCECESREESIEQFTREILKMLKDNPTSLIQAINDMVGDLEIFYEEKNSLISRINSLV